MRTSKSFTAFVTSLAFLSQTCTTLMPTAEAQAQAGAPTATGGFTVPTYNPAQLNMQSPALALQNKIAMCQAKALGENENVKTGIAKLGELITKTKAKTPAKAGAKTAGGKDCYETVKAKGDFTCDMTCKEPPANLLVEPSCGTYFNKKHEVQVSKNPLKDDKEHNDWVPKDEKKLPDAITQLSTYNLFLSFKATCPSEDAVAMKKKLAAYNCAVQALQSATAEASNMLQAGLQANATQYGKMLQFQQEVGDQVRQIDEILGPDKEIGSAGGGQFQGLLGMQRALNAEMPKMIEAEATFKSQSEQIIKETSAHEQTLEADKMGQVVDCMKGNRNLGVSGGRSLTCFKPSTRTSTDASGKQVSSPVTDAAGNMVYSKQPCGALEYVRSQVEQSAYISRNGPIRSQARIDESQQRAAAFDSMIDAMTRDMGGYDAGSAEGKLVGRNTKWEDLAKKYSGDMAELSSKTGINIQSQMSSVAKSCYRSGDEWRKQQLKSDASPYARKKRELTANKEKLTAQMNAGLGELNKSYGEAMAVLGKQAVSIDRRSCTTSDTNKMQQCYSDMRKQVTDLLEGNGKSVTTKTFTGGSYVGGFTVPCKGINGCVTALQNVRTAKKEQNANAQKAKVEFVRSGNDAVQKQLTAFAQQLNQVQQSVAAQFGDLKQFLLDKKVKAPGNLKFLDPEALKTAETPDKTTGPFETPKNMAAALSGLVQPTGLLNFADTGIDALTDAAIEKTEKDASSAKEKSEKYAAAATKLSELTDKCTEDNIGQDQVANNPSRGVNCATARAQFQMAEQTKVTPEVANVLYAGVAALFGMSTDASANSAVALSSEQKNELADKVRDCDTQNSSKTEKREANSATAAGSDKAR